MKGGSVKIAYFTALTNHIYFVDDKGLHSQSIAVLNARAVSVAWFPNGSKIVFSEVRANDATSLLKIVNLITGTQSLLFYDPAEPPGQLSVSPDGGKIAYVSFTRDATPPQLWTIDADGTNRRQQTNLRGPVAGPMWLSASRIVFVAGSGDDSDILAINVHNGNLQSLTNNPEADSEPSPSPDGTQIAYRSRRNGKTGIFIMNADGTNDHAVTPLSDFYRGEPQWSPKNSRILFLDDPPRRISVVDIDGKNLKEIASPQARPVFMPRWLPDGKRFAYFTSRSDGGFSVYVTDLDENVTKTIVRLDESLSGGALFFAVSPTKAPY